MIHGSTRWVDDVPDNYAIQCIESYPSPVERTDKILKFLFVKRADPFHNDGFVQVCGTTIIPYGTKSIVILKNNFSPMPNVYYVYANELIYAGQLAKCEVSTTVHKTPRFHRIYHYSAETFGRQKSDLKAPDWLKDFAKQYNGSVAYFKF